MQKQTDRRVSTIYRATDADTAIYIAPDAEKDKKTCIYIVTDTVTDKQPFIYTETDADTDRRTCIYIVRFQIQTDRRVSI